MCTKLALSLHLCVVSRNGTRLLRFKWGSSLTRCSISTGPCWLLERIPTSLGCPKAPDDLELLIFQSAGDRWPLSHAMAEPRGHKHEASTLSTAPVLLRGAYAHYGEPGKCREAKAFLSLTDPRPCSFILYTTVWSLHLHAYHLSSRCVFFFQK